MRTRVDTQLRIEAEQFSFRFACDDCAHFHPTLLRFSLPDAPPWTGATSNCARPSSCADSPGLMPRSHPPTLITLVRASLREHQLLPRGSTVLVAVSGGPDSMALLHVLASIRKSFAFGLF